jgi:hypothetical protein
LTLADAGGFASRRRRATSRLFFEAVKWRAVWPLKSRVYEYDKVEKEERGKKCTFGIHVCFFAEKEID